MTCTSYGRYRRFGQLMLIQRKLGYLPKTDSPASPRKPLEHIPTKKVLGDSQTHLGPADPRLVRVDVTQGSSEASRKKKEEEKRQSHIKAS